MNVLLLAVRVLCCSCARLQQPTHPVLFRWRLLETVRNRYDPVVYNLQLLKTVTLLFRFAGADGARMSSWGSSAGNVELFVTASNGRTLVRLAARHRGKV